ncbi:MAG TPA: amino acid deaminase [Candidatus Brachybacterium merdavium]|uniref:Amino acid deaminase n=1 Tax=Candidatus Brachybacterium merdavium TaxID=2838513 RepID=A0A9D2LE75_9MICO|nr:amino acid deaminase [Candidatus Brachybacterium merdavium]
MEDLKAAPLGSGRDGFEQILRRRPALDQLPTPLVTLSESAIAHNLATMAAWCRSAGVELAPHGKTTMNRQLWRRQLDAGAWGITVATPWQASVALDWEIPRVLLANALVQPAALTVLAPSAGRLTVWSDSSRGVEIMHEALTAAGAQEQLSVIVELGAQDGRTGVRTLEDGLEIARAISASPALRLAGVGGYEGALAHDAQPDSLHRVRAYLEQIGALHDLIAAEDLYPSEGEVLLTAGGSAYFDEVADVLAHRHDPQGRRGPATRVLLRSGAYLAHDDGFYRGISPLSRTTESGTEEPREQESQSEPSGAGARFRAAMHGWATVVSRPEPGLALVDAGKRDFSFDEGLPEPQLLRRLGERAAHPLDGAQCTAMNDQHTFVTIPPHTALEVGDVIRFGLSHPCTVFDKWRGMVVIDDDHADVPRAIDLLETAFG